MTIKYGFPVLNKATTMSLIVSKVNSVTSDSEAIFILHKYA